MAGNTFADANTYEVTMPVGSVIGLDIRGSDGHPFHLHVNSYQLSVDPIDTFDGYFQAGDWHDTIITPNDDISAHFQTDVFTGKQVIHCHILEHEDLGMMLVTQITGSEGTLCAGATSIDPTCFRAGSTAGAPTITTEGTCSVAPFPSSPSPLSPTPSLSMLTFEKAKLSQGGKKKAAKVIDMDLSSYGKIKDAVSACPMGWQWARMP